MASAEDVNKVENTLRGMSLTNAQADQLKAAVDCRVGAFQATHILTQTLKRRLGIDHGRASVEAIELLNELRAQGITLAES